MNWKLFCANYSISEWAPAKHLLLGVEGRSETHFQRDVIPNSLESLILNPFCD